MNIEDKIRKLQQNKEHIFESSKYTYLKTTDAFEMRAFIGFIYLRGLYKLNHHDHQSLVQFSQQIEQSFSLLHYHLLPGKNVQ